MYNGNNHSLSADYHHAVCVDELHMLLLRPAPFSSFTHCAMNGEGPIPYLCTRHGRRVHKGGTVSVPSNIRSQRTHLLYLAWTVKGILFSSQ